MPDRPPPPDVRLARERLAAQLLAGTAARDVVSVVDRLLAVQAQDLRGARLAVRARSRGLVAADVDRALAERALVVTWLQRGTLHLVRAEDYPWLQALTAPSTRAGNRRRLAQEGVSADLAERGLRVITRVLASDGPSTRARLGDALRSAGVPTRGQGLVHLLVLASLDGLVVRGPVVAGEQAFVLVREWLGPPPVVDRDVALAALARRFLAGHGPASDADLATWSGLPLRDTRRALSAIGPELRPRPDGLVVLAGRRRTPPLPPPRLLGPFDPVLFGWRSRSWVLGDQVPVVTVNGIFRPVALVSGRAVATWRAPGGHVELEPFRDLDSDERAALAADADDVARFSGERA